MGNSCVFSCWNNRVEVVDNNIKKNTLVKTDNFDIKKYNPMILGCGVSSNAFKLNMNNHIITCKKVKKQHFDTAYQEIKILKEIGHTKYLPVFFKAIETKNHLYIMYEYLDGIDLMQMIQTPTYDVTNINNISIIIKEITLGLYSLFKHNYIHLDIKFENIIISTTKPIKIKIIDLAFCKKLDKKNHLQSIIGTNGYVSPEVIMFKRYFHNTDVWSIGVVLYGLLTDKPLFHKTKNYLTMVQELQKFEVSCISDELNNLDKDATDLIKKMLQKNPSSRISLKQILKHNFITRME
tara:strand:+ start:345 stop:1226 length:882 start_codon:yes stop_codon:yes gene_type:complete